jgi:hypothetical protein
MTSALRTINNLAHGSYAALRKILPKISATCRNPTHQDEAADARPRPAASHRSVRRDANYPPHENGDDARSITFIMRLPFGIDVLLG